MTADTWEKIGYALGGAVAAFITMGKPLLDVIHRKSKILWANEKILSQQAIYRLITDMRAEFRLDRVDITEFTNGEHTLAGVGFVFGNMTYEVCDLPLKSIKNEYKRFTTSWLASLYAPLISATTKSVLWTDDGHYVVNWDQDGKTEDEGGVLLRADRIKSKLIIKFTSNIGDGIITLSSYDEVITLSKQQYGIIISNVHRIWYHLKLKR